MQSMKRVYMRRCISLLLVAVLCLSCAQLPALAVGDEGTSDAPNGFLSDISIVRRSNDLDPVYEYDTASGELKPFTFVADQTEYNIVLPEVATGMSTNLFNPNIPVTTAKLSDDACGTSVDLYSTWALTGTPKELSDLITGGGSYSNGLLKIAGTNLRTRLNLLTVGADAPVTLYYLTGDIKTETRISYTRLDVYTFNFYRMAGLGGWPTVKDESGTEYTVDGYNRRMALDPYINTFSVTVPAGTETLNVTAKPVTPDSTSVQFDDGKDSHVTGESDVYTLTLADYGDAYKQDDGSLKPVYAGV